MPVANMDMEGKYIKALLAFEEVQKTVVDEELGMRERLSTLEEKMEAVCINKIKYRDLPQILFFIWVIAGWDRS